MGAGQCRLGLPSPVPRMSNGFASPCPHLPLSSFENARFTTSSPAWGFISLNIFADFDECQSTVRSESCPPFSGSCKAGPYTLAGHLPPGNIPGWEKGEPSVRTRGLLLPCTVPGHLLGTGSRPLAPGRPSWGWPCPLSPELQYLQPAHSSHSRAVPGLAGGPPNRPYTAPCTVPSGGEGKRMLGTDAVLVKYFRSMVGWARRDGGSAAGAQTQLAASLTM